MLARHKEFRQEVGCRMWRARLRRGLTQKEAARLAGVGCQGVVARVEKGNNLRIETILALCYLYRADVARVLKREGGW